MNTHFYCKSLCALTASLLLAATAGAAANDKEQKPAPIKGSDCVFARTVYDWKELDENNLVLWAPGRRSAYHVYFAMPLVGVKFSVQLAFVDKDNDGQLCGFSRDQIAIADRSFPQSSMITAMKKLDAEGIAKLEEQYKVSLTSDSKKKKPKEPAAATAQ